MAATFTYRLLPSGDVLLTPDAGTTNHARQGGSLERQDPPVGTKPPATTEGQTERPPGTQERQPDCFGSMMWILPVFVLLYFVMIRPQQKQEKAKRAMLAALKKGDHIVTGGGIHGQVAAIHEGTVTIKFGSEPGQRLKIERAAVSRIVTNDETKKAKDSAS